MTTKTTIVYPDSDGMPLPDGEYQAPIYVKILGTLQLHFNEIPGARVNGDTFIYYTEGNPHVFVSPDCYVALNLSDDQLASIERNNVYLLWEVGRAPDFMLEIASKSTARNDLVGKRELYAELGVNEYWRYDKTGGEFYGESLVGERLVAGEYRRIDMRHESEGRVWAHSDALNLDLWWIDGELRFWDCEAEGWLLTMEEEHARAEEERARAEEERARAEEERAARMTAEVYAEVERARAELERAGRVEAESRAYAAEAELRRLRARLDEMGEPE